MELNAEPKTVLHVRVQPCKTDGVECMAGSSISVKLTEKRQKEPKNSAKRNVDFSKN